jgi:hypothetical protein
VVPKRVFADRQPLRHESPLWLETGHRGGQVGQVVLDENGGFGPRQTILMAQQEQTAGGQAAVDERARQAQPQRVIGTFLEDRNARPTPAGEQHIHDSLCGCLQGRVTFGQQRQELVDFRRAEAARAECFDVLRLDTLA